MGGRGGLIELALAFCFALAWGALELRCRQLDRRKADETRREKGDAPKT